MPALIAGAAAALTAGLLYAARRHEDRTRARTDADAARLQAAIDTIDQLSGGERRVGRGVSFARSSTEPVRAAPPAPKPGPVRPAAGSKPSYVITGLSQPRLGAEVTPLDGSTFADVFLREAVVRGAALAYGLRSALSAESRNRIRFEIRREVKRSRKERRAEVKIAVREYRERQRAQQTGEDR